MRTLFSLTMVVLTTASSPATAADYYLNPDEALVALQEEVASLRAEIEEYFVGLPHPNGGRIAYNSGWVETSPGSWERTLSHNVGGNPDSYFVFLDFKGLDADRAIHNNSIGSRYVPSNPQCPDGGQQGAYYDGLTSSHVKVTKLACNDRDFQWVRVRIITP